MNYTPAMMYIIILDLLVLLLAHAKRLELPKSIVLLLSNTRFLLKLPHFIFLAWLQEDLRNRHFSI